jgi:hypothetical protein
MTLPRATVNPDPPALDADLSMPISRCRSRASLRIRPELRSSQLGGHSAPPRRRAKIRIARPYRAGRNPRGFCRRRVEARAARCLRRVVRAGRPAYPSHRTRGILGGRIVRATSPLVEVAECGRANRSSASCQEWQNGGLAAMKVAAGLAGDGPLAAEGVEPAELTGRVRLLVLGVCVAASAPAALHASVPPTAVVRPVLHGNTHRMDPGRHVISELVSGQVAPGSPRPGRRPEDLALAKPAASTGRSGYDRPGCALPRGVLGSGMADRR